MTETRPTQYGAGATTGTGRYLAPCLWGGAPCLWGKSWERMCGFASFVPKPGALSMDTGSNGGVGCRVESGCHLPMLVKKDER